MARTVDEIVNRELLSVPQDAGRDTVLQAILGFGVTAVPVLDGDRRPVGVVSLRDLVDGGALAARMRAPVETISASATIADAGRRLDATGLHHLVVVDGDGRAVGMLSSLDVVRGLLGLPARHPAAFPHHDPALGVAWTDDTVLEQAFLGVAPDGPGVLVLVHNEAGVPAAVVWAEACAHVRARLEDLVSAPQSDHARLAHLLARGHLCFRAAAVADAAERARVVERVLEPIGHLAPPQAKAIAEDT